MISVHLYFTFATSPNLTQWITVLHSLYWDLKWNITLYVHLSSRGICRNAVLRTTVCYNTQRNQVKSAATLQMDILACNSTSAMSCPLKSWLILMKRRLNKTSSQVKLQPGGVPSDVLGPDCSYRVMSSSCSWSFVAHPCDLIKTDLQVLWRGI